MAGNDILWWISINTQEINKLISVAKLLTKYLVIHVIPEWKEDAIAKSPTTKPQRG